MKNWLLIGLFLVTWNEFQLQSHYDGISYSEHDHDGNAIWNPQGHLEYYTVELTTCTVMLATQKDVNLFINGSKEFTVPGKSWSFIRGLIGDKAFNIKVTEQGDHAEN